MSSSSQAFLSTVNSHQIKDGFIKVTDSPVSTLTDQQKVILNRRANELFNNGKIDEASRIFITTGYSDGLTRTGDYFMKKNQMLTALKFYQLAKNKNKSSIIIEKIASAIKMLVKEN